MKLRILSGLWLLLLAGAIQAEEVELNPAHPERYTVVPGDTLWGIAGKFLAKPWQWPNIWHDNPQIPDPHWIYPGDELVLTMVDGKPVLQVGQRAAAERPDEVRLSPTIRVSPLGPPIPTIPMSAIQQFLIQPKVVSADTLQNAPYVVAFADEHIVGGAGDRVYVRGIADSQTVGYVLFRPGKPYKDAETDEVLGYEAVYVANGELQARGDPSTLKISSSGRDINIGDRIMPVEAMRMQMRYQPHVPTSPIRGHVIGVVDGVSQIGQWNVVIIDRGGADGVETGHVLEIRQSGYLQRDIVSPNPNETIELPQEKEGMLMVFRAFDRISFALVMSATKAIHINDAVVTP